MKIRNGFVSNSSSSSFIFLAKGNPKPIIVDDLYLDETAFWKKEKILKLSPGNTHSRFGWEWRKYKEWTEKAVWAWLQIWYANEMLANTNGYVDKHFVEMIKKEGKTHPKEWLDMLNKVIKEYTDVVSVDWSKLESSIKDYEAYIDHQSLCTEDYNMISIFYSEEVLASFIFHGDSYIATGNDNGSPPGGWYFI